MFGKEMKHIGGIISDRSPCMRIESIDDDEMRGFDIEEHRDILAAGIPEHLGICTYSMQYKTLINCSVCLLYYTFWLLFGILLQWRMHDFPERDANSKFGHFSWKLQEIEKKIGWGARDPRPRSVTVLLRELKRLDLIHFHFVRSHGSWKWLNSQSSRNTRYIT